MDDNNASGDLDIKVNVNITGHGAGSSIIDGGGVDRVFRICPGGGCARSVTFTGVTIRNGDTAGGGGGIFIKDSTVTVDSSTVSANTAACNGGGVFSNENLANATSVTGSCIMGNSDTSFFNSEAAMQIATGNWWGAASGPSGVGPGSGDSVSASVDYSGFLTEPILGRYLYTFLPLVVQD